MITSDFFQGLHYTVEKRENNYLVIRIASSVCEFSKKLLPVSNCTSLHSNQSDNEMPVSNTECLTKKRKGKNLSFTVLRNHPKRSVLDSDKICLKMAKAVFIFMVRLSWQLLL